MLHSNYKEHFKRNFYLAYPVMLSQLGNVMVGVADSIMVGRLGTTPLAAASLGNSIFSVAMMFGIGISYAITPLVALSDGKKTTAQAGDFFKHGLYIDVTVGVLLFLLVTVGSLGLYNIDQPLDVVALAIPYLGIISFSLIPFMFFQTYKQFAEGLSQTKQAMYIIVLSNLLNIGLNYLLIYGKLGFPALGLNGAGWATLISRIVMALAIAHYIHHSKRYSVYFEKLQWRLVKKAIFIRMLKIGFPSGLQFIFEVGAFSFAAIMVGWLGAKSLAAHQIALSLASVSYMMATGISAAATVRVGNQLGKSDFLTMRTAGFTNFSMVLMFMSITCVIFLWGNTFLPSLFIKETAVIETAATLVVIAGFFQLSDGVQVVGLGALRGMGDVKIPTIITLVAYWVIGLPLGYILSFKFGWGVQGVWYGLLIGLTVTAILMLYRFHYISKQLMMKGGQTIPAAK